MQDVSLAQARDPLDRTNYYFELEIISTGSLGAIAIGVGKSSYPLHNHPGWSIGAVGYHADDGKLFVEHGKGQEFGPSCVSGDRMGCGIIFTAHDEMEGKLAAENKEASKEGTEEDVDDDDSDSVNSVDDDDDLYFPEEDLFDDEALLYREMLGRAGGLLGLGRGRPRLPYGANIAAGGGPPFNVFDRIRHRNAPVVRPQFGGVGGMGRLHQGVQPAVRGSVKDDNSGNKCTVYFTKNGEKVGDTQVCVPRGGFFPLVGLLSKGERVRVDLHPLTG